jgi:hypothetical protein
VVLHQEVDVPDQTLLPTVAFHGILDYLIGVVSAKHGVSSSLSITFFSKPFVSAQATLKSSRMCQQSS